MAKIIINDFTLGLAPYFWINSTTFASKLGVNGQITQGEINPFYMPGYLLGGSSSYTAVTNESDLTDNGRIEKIIAVDDRIIDTSTGTSIYAIQNTGSAGQFHALTGAGVLQYSASTPKWPKVANTSSSTHNGHTNVIFDDVFQYQINGVYKTMVLMRDGTDWDILGWDSTLTGGDVLSNIGSAATSYSTGLVDKTYPTFAIVSDNGFAYIANKNVLHKFDGTSTSGGSVGTFTANALVMANSRMFVDGVDHKGKIWLLTEPLRTLNSATSSSTEKYASWAHRDISVIVWGRSSTLVSVDDSIKIGGVSEALAICVIDGIVHVFARGGGPSTSSSRGVTKLFAYNGSKFVLVKELGDELSGYPPVTGSISSYNNGVVWQDTNGVMWWYGNIQRTGQNITGSVFMIGKTSSGSVTQSGSGAALSTGAGILCSRIESGAMKLGFMNPMADATSGNPSYINLTPIELPKLSTVNGLTIVFYAEANASTATVSVDIYNKHNATPVTKYIDLDVDVPRGYVYFPLKLEKTNILGLRFGTGSSLTNATMPKIARIEVDYTPTPRLR